MKLNLSFEAKQSGTELHIYSCFNKTQEVKTSKAAKTTSLWVKDIINDIKSKM